MHFAFEQYPVLDGVYGSMRKISRRNGDPTTVVRIFPLLLIVQRKYMSGFKELPPPRVR